MFFAIELVDEELATLDGNEIRLDVHKLENTDPPSITKLLLFVIQETRPFCPIFSESSEATF